MIKQIVDGAIGGHGAMVSPLLRRWHSPLVVRDDYADPSMPGPRAGGRQDLDLWRPGLRQSVRRQVSLRLVDKPLPGGAHSHDVMKIFSDQHEMFRATVRAFVDREIAPHIEAWEAAGRMPRWIWPRMGELGLLGVEYDE
jgi:hypothetical protein